MTCRQDNARLPLSASLASPTVDLKPLLDHRAETIHHLGRKPRNLLGASDEGGRHRHGQRLSDRDAPMRPEQAGSPLCERQLTELREELVEAIKWDRLRRRDLYAQRFA